MRTVHMVNGRWVAAAALILGSALPLAAHADTYNILLKQAGGGAVGCATGSFDFSKAGGTQAVNVTVNLQDPCLGMPAGAYQGSLSVIVENVTIAGQDQGPNVVGLNGTLAKAGGGSLVFAYGAGSASTTPSRPLTLDSGTPPSVSSTYHLYNTNAVPAKSSPRAALVFM